MSIEGPPKSHEREDKSDELVEGPINVFAEQYRPGSWEVIGGDILAIEQEAFGDKAFTPEFLEWQFEEMANVNILLRDRTDRRIIGFTSAFSEPGDTFHIANTVIREEYRGRGYVGLLMKKLEAEMRSRGGRDFTRNALIENGYADKIQEHYKDRIIDQREGTSEWGPTKYFRIKL